MASRTPRMPRPSGDCGCARAALEAHQCTPQDEWLRRRGRFEWSERRRAQRELTGVRHAGRDRRLRHIRRSMLPIRRRLRRLLGRRLCSRGPRDFECQRPSPPLPRGPLLARLVHWPCRQRRQRRQCRQCRRWRHCQRDSQCRRQRWRPRCKLLRRWQRAARGRVCAGERQPTRRHGAVECARPARVPPPVVPQGQLARGATPLSAPAGWGHALALTRAPSERGGSSHAGRCTRSSNAPPGPLSSLPLGSPTRSLSSRCRPTPQRAEAFGAGCLSDLRVGGETRLRLRP